MREVRDRGGRSGPGSGRGLRVGAAPGPAACGASWAGRGAERGPRGGGSTAGRVNGSGARADLAPPLRARSEAPPLSEGPGGTPGGLNCVLVTTF